MPRKDSGEAGRQFALVIGSTKWIGSAVYSKQAQAVLSSTTGDDGLVISRGIPSPRSSFRRQLHSKAPRLLRTAVSTAADCTPRSADGMEGTADVTARGSH